MAIDEHTKALSDLEQAIPLLQRASQRWDERLAHQDIYPLSPSEVISMRYTKSYLAHTYGEYSSLLSFLGQRQKAMEVMQQSLHLYSEIGMLPTNILTFSTKSEGDTWFGALDAKSYFECTSCGEKIAQGESECSSCGLSICFNCGVSLNEHDLTCPNCGTEFDLVCSECNAVINPETSSCPNCGTSF